MFKPKAEKMVLKCSIKKKFDTTFKNVVTSF